MTDKVSYFANPQRNDLKELYNDVDEVSISPIIGEMLTMVPNFLAILNSNRQIITLNFTFMSYLGVENPSDLLGLRLGEALNCNYSKDMPAGCGTSKYCSSCGAAISMVSALENNNNTERFCSILATKEGKTTEYFLSIKSTRIYLNKKKYLLIFLNDITEYQKRAYLEKTFFGDISNLINLLNDNVNFISKNHSELESQCSDVKNIANLISKEIEFQKALFNPQEVQYFAEKEKISINQLFDGILKIFENNPVASAITFSIIPPQEKKDFISDYMLIMRILIHMLTNAFEHSKPQAVVRLWFDVNENVIIFNVWNDYYIPEETAIRIFQKYFTTHDSIGRGLGTYFMKYFAETVLGGTVNFTTSKTNGTTFKLILPKLS